MRLTNAFFANHAEVVDDMLNVTGGCWTSTTVADGSTAFATRCVVFCDVSRQDRNKQFGLHIDEDTYTTAGGYVLGRIGRRARVGDTIDVEGRKMRVTGLDGLRVAKVWLSTPLHDEAPPEEGTDSV